MKKRKSGESHKITSDRSLDRVLIKPVDLWHLLYIFGHKSKVFSSKRHLALSPPFCQVDNLI